MSVLIKDYYGLKKVELKECPFCGSSELIIVRQSNPDEDTIDDYSYLFNVKCCNCFSQGAKKYMEQDAIDAWNSRASSAE